jgi:hypothetical protein
MKRAIALIVLFMECEQKLCCQSNFRILSGTGTDLTNQTIYLKTEQDSCYSGCFEVENRSHKNLKLKVVRLRHSDSPAIRASMCYDRNCYSFATYESLCKVLNAGGKVSLIIHLAYTKKDRPFQVQYMILNCDHPNDSVSFRIGSKR